VYLSCEIPLLFPRPRIESRGLTATGAMTSMPSIPKLSIFFCLFPPRPLLREFARHIYLRSTNFVVAPPPENDYHVLEVQLKFHAGAQIGRDRILRGRKVSSIPRVRGLDVFLAYPRPERGCF